VFFYAILFFLRPFFLFPFRLLFSFLTFLSFASFLFFWVRRLSLSLFSFVFFGCLFIYSGRESSQ
jgi:hypothetical protein